MIRLLAAAALLTLAACATPAQRISTKLVELGVPSRQAECMGDKLQQRLSLSQLRRLAEVTRGRDEKLSFREIARRLDDTGDPALVAEVLRAGVGCVL